MTNKRQSKRAVTAVGKWIAIGIAIGVGVGASLDNIALGLVVGIVLGAAIGRTEIVYKNKTSNHD